jgi:hypothetical protein
MSFAEATTSSIAAPADAGSRRARTDIAFVRWKCFPVGVTLFIARSRYDPDTTRPCTARAYAAHEIATNAPQKGSGRPARRVRARVR